MKKEVMLVTGAGQISMAIARRIGFGKKIILGDKKIENANTIAKIMNEAGYDVVPFEMDLSSRESIPAIIAEAQKEIADIVTTATEKIILSADVKKSYDEFLKSAEGNVKNE